MSMRMLIRLLSSAAMASVLLGACAPVSPATPTAAPSAVGQAATPKTGGKLTIGISADIQKLDPHLSYVVVDRYVTENVYEGLVRLDDKMDPVPALAASWKQIDPTNYEFTMRQGAQFH